MPPRTTVANAIEYLRNGLTVTEGQWPKRVIDSLEDRYQKQRRWTRVPEFMGYTYPPSNKIDGLRWFFGWRLL